MREELFAVARRASRIICEKAGKACGISCVAYSQHENSPKGFRLSELRSMCAALSDTAKPIWMEAVCFIFAVMITLNAILIRKEDDMPEERQYESLVGLYQSLRDRIEVLKLRENHDAREIARLRRRGVPR